MKIVYYENKKFPVEEFILHLPVLDKAKIFGCLKNIEELGFSTPRVEFSNKKSYGK